MPETIVRAAAASKEGLPYWIFWLLLSLIFLLLLFIFLRDKDLRRRLSLILAGAKKRMLIKRLELRLRRQKRRKTILWREIGRTIWAGRIDGDRFGPSFSRLGRLETQIAARHVVLLGLNNQIAAAAKRLEDSRKIRDDAPENRGVEDDRRLKRQLKELQRKAKAERGRIRHRSREKATEYERLGLLADENRVSHPDLEGFHVRVDEANRVILAIMDKIEKLS
jgi:hypothetical protein